MSFELSLSIVLLVSFLAPLLVSIVPKLHLSPIIVLIVMGLIIGPSGLNIAQDHSALKGLARLGMAFLFFQAGLELDFRSILGRPLLWGALGWLFSLLLAFTFCFALKSLGLIHSDKLVMAALVTTSLGTLLPILRDENETDTLFGRYVIAAATFGEFAPLVLITLLFSQVQADNDHSHHLLFSGIFLGGLLLSAMAALKIRPPKLINLLNEGLHGSNQLPVRLAICTLTTLTLLTSELGFESVLGSVAAGILVRLALSQEMEHQVKTKLETIAYGVFIPIFFVRVGIVFDVDALLASHKALIMVPIFLLLLLIVRGAPVLFLKNTLPRKDLWSLALMSSTTLSLVIAISHIGLDAHLIAADTSTALISAAMLGKILYPSLAMMLKGRDQEILESIEQ